MSSSENRDNIAIYPHQTEENIRFCDTDAVGHVNNTAFAAYLEAGRIGMSHEKGMREIFGKLNLQLVLVSLNIKFIREVHWPGKVIIGTGILHIGNSSIGFS